MCVCVCVCVCVCLPKFSFKDRIQHKKNLEEKYSLFEIGIFFFLR